jgi:hypothetical protein
MKPLSGTYVNNEYDSSELEDAPTTDPMTEEGESKY